MSDDITNRIAAMLRKRYESEDYASVCAHCSDDWADNVAAAVVNEITDDLTNRIAHVISRCYHDDPWAVAVAVVEELGLRNAQICDSSLAAKHTPVASWEPWLPPWPP
jgi:hypothetical protein